MARESPSFVGLIGHKLLPLQWLLEMSSLVGQAIKLLQKVFFLSCRFQIYIWHIFFVYYSSGIYFYHLINFEGIIWSVIFVYIFIFVYIYTKIIQILFSAFENFCNDALAPFLIIKQRNFFLTDLNHLNKVNTNLTLILGGYGQFTKSTSV